MKTRFSLMALMVTSITAHAQTPFNQTYFFGDSQTDSGYFAKIANQINSPSGKFVTNPDKVWAEHFADYYGTSAKSISENGTNYAAGGALSGTDMPHPQFTGVTIPSAATQINNYLQSTGGKANPNALYTITSGANDLLVAQQNPSNATEAIKTAAKQKIDAINKLHDAGAKYIIVPNVPDIGASPYARVGGKPVQQAVTEASSGYNTLFTGELINSKANIIPWDVFHLIQEVTNNPNEYGFKNATSTACDPTVAPSSLLCNQKTLVEPNANKDYFFADNLHLSGSGQEIVSDYAISVMQAPAQMNSITHHLAQQGTQATQQLHRQIDALPSQASSAWLEVGGEKHQNNAGNNQSTPYLSAGVGFGNQSRKLGVHLRSSKQKQDWQNGGGYDTKIVGGGLFYRQNFGKIRMTGAVDYDHYSLETNRHVQLGAANRIHKADSKGSRINGSLRGAYHIKPNENLSLNPYLGINTQRIDIDSINEDQPDLSTSMTFSKMKHKSVNGEVGMNANWQVAPRTLLSGSLNFSHNFAKPEEYVAARLRTVSSLQFKLPATEPNKNTTTAAIGVRHLIGNTSLTAGVSGYRGSKDVKGANVFMGVNHHF